MKTTVLLILLAAAALAIAFFIFSRPGTPVTQADAEKFFLDDLASKYPNADIREITDILPLTASDGTPYYELKARVTSGMSTPCPERINVYYDYPPKNFVAQPPEYITKGCEICINEPVCTIAFPEEAIIASHTYTGAEKVEQFIKANADASAGEPAFMDSYGGYFGGVWIVNWSSASANASYSVLVSKSQNKVLQVTKTS